MRAWADTVFDVDHDEERAVDLGERLMLVLRGRGGEGRGGAGTGREGRGGEGAGGGARGGGG